MNEFFEPDQVGVDRDPANPIWKNPEAFDALTAEIVALRRDLDDREPVVSAAVLVAAAFKLRDQAALLSALRILKRAVDRFEQTNEPAGDETAD